LIAINWIADNRLLAIIRNQFFSILERNRYDFRWISSYHHSSTWLRSKHFGIEFVALLHRHFDWLSSRMLYGPRSANHGGSPGRPIIASRYLVWFRVGTREGTAICRTRDRSCRSRLARREFGRLEGPPNMSETSRLVRGTPAPPDCRSRRSAFSSRHFVDVRLLSWKIK